MFSDEDLKKVRAAVQAAERRTRGEIVPMVVRRSAYYREARHLAGLAVAIVAVTLLLAFQHGWGHWAGPRYYFGWVLLGGIVAYVFGHWAGSQPFGIRLFISQERMKHKVRLRAELAFYQH